MRRKFNMPYTTSAMKPPEQFLTSSLDEGLIVARRDGQRLFVNFLNRGAIYITALDLDGRQLWQTRVSDFATHQGFSSSPALYGPLVVVTTDSRSGGVVAALDRGSEVVATC